MGQHKLKDVQAFTFLAEALDRRQKTYGKFRIGDKIVLEREKDGWHGYYLCMLGTPVASKPIKKGV